jgi:hypothetical protein
MLSTLAGGAGVTWYFWRQQELRRAAMEQVKPLDVLSAQQTKDFIQSLPIEEKRGLWESLGLPPEATFDLNEVMWRFAELKNHTFMNWWRAAAKAFGYPPPELDYQETLDWVHHEFQARTFRRSTFAVERGIVEAVARQSWDGMNASQRQKVLEQAKVNFDPVNVPDPIAIDGKTFVSLFRFQGSVAAEGFAFYTGVSSLLHATAAAAGATLPFAVYTTVSSAIKFLAGPWAIAALGIIFIAQNGIFGFPNAKNLAPFIFSLHSLKAAKLEHGAALRDVSRQLDFV